MATSEMKFMDHNGKIVYYKPEFTYPDSWNYNDALMFAKHFSTPGETSIEQSMRRVLSPFKGIVDQAIIDDMFDLLINQKACLNSPAMFNLGVNENPVASACFIVAVEDDMTSIADMLTQSIMIFKNGAGMGASFHKLRASMEKLGNSDGVSSGPVPFMRILDSAGNVVKSGGKHRRAAIMVINRVDHPDIYEFISCKMEEEKKAIALGQAGYGTGIESEAYRTVAFQNMNISVSVTDEFMEKAADGEMFDLTYRRGGAVHKSVPADDILTKIAESCWACGDPGLQFFDTINKDNPFASLGKKYTINASNPCISGESYCLTDMGWKQVKELDGQEVHIKKPYHWEDARASESHAKFYKTGTKKTKTLTFHTDEMLVDFRVVNTEDIKRTCSVTTTVDHLYMTDSGYVKAEDISPATKVRMFDWGRYDTVECHLVSEIDNTEDMDVYDFTVMDGSEPCGIFQNDEHGSIGIVLHNCSEFLFLDNSACNLASLNLNKFYDGTSFDYGTFNSACRTLVFIQDAIVDIASYPTEEIARNSKKYRPLGLGFTGLGSLLMRMCIPYGSEEACKFVNDVSYAMTISAWHASAELCKLKGDYFTDQERQALQNHIWRKFGLDLSPRNSQVTLLAPTGTISFIMGTGDSTGIEALMALDATKQVVGGGSIHLKSEAAVEAAARLGKASVEEALKDPVTRPIFATSYGEVKVTPQQQLSMMSAAQKWLSGAISKTLSVPNSSTIDDIKQVYIDAWRQGIKCLAVYRDGSKMSQPVSVTKKEEAKAPKRERMPETRMATTHHFEIMGEDGYVTLGHFPDGRIGEIFVSMHKQGSTVQGLLHAWSISLSMALQYGAPLEDMIKKFRGMKFDPSGFTTNREIEMCHSIVDYVSQYVTSVIGGSPIAENYEPSVIIREGSEDNTRTCPDCGNVMLLSGRCHRCTVCGATGGCS